MRWNNGQRKWKSNRKYLGALPNYLFSAHLGDDVCSRLFHAFTREWQQNTNRQTLSLLPFLFFEFSAIPCSLVNFIHFVLGEKCAHFEMPKLVSDYSYGSNLFHTFETVREHMWTASIVQLNDRNELHLVFFLFCSNRIRRSRNSGKKQQFKKSTNSNKKQQHLSEKTASHTVE